MRPKITTHDMHNYLYYLNTPENAIRFIVMKDIQRIMVRDSYPLVYSSDS